MLETVLRFVTLCLFFFGKKYMSPPVQHLSDLGLASFTLDSGTHWQSNDKNGLPEMLSEFQYLRLWTSRLLIVSSQ